MSDNAIPFVDLLIGDHRSREVSFIAVHDRLSPILTTAHSLGGVPVLGSPAWVDLAEDDIRWRHSVVVSGYQWALRRWLEQDAETAASKEVSQQQDWSAHARYVRDRKQYFEANPWAKRVSA